MSLQLLIESSIEADNIKQGLSEERLNAQLDNIRSLIAFYRQYPDLLIDFMKGPESTFNFYFYQRIN